MARISNTSRFDMPDTSGTVAPSGYGIYDQLFQNNPYRNLNYNRSFWQKLLGSFGFRTDYDRFLEEQQVNAKEYDMGVYQQMFQDQYNSEAAKSARMREAGENPDLLGTGNVSDAASPLEDPQGMSPGATDTDAVLSLGSGVVSAFNSAVGIASQFMQLDGLRSDIEGKNISNAENMMNVIKQRVLGLTPAEGFKTDQEFADWKRKTEATLRTNYGKAFFKGSGLRRWNRSIDDFIGGLPTSKEQYADWKSRLGDAKSYLLGREDHWSDSIELFKVINEELISLQNELTENEQVLKNTETDAKIETATNELQYQEDLEPGMHAAADNAEWKRQYEGKTVAGILNEHLSKLTKRLDDFSKQGGFKGLLGELVLLFLTMRGASFKVGENGMSLSMPNVQTQ